MNYICDFCGVSCITKYKLSAHQNTERCKFIQNKLNNLKNENQKNVLEYEHKIQKLEYDLKNALAMSDEYKKIVEKAVTRPTSITNNKTENIVYLSSEPIKFSNMREQLSNIINIDNITKSDTKFNNLIFTNILQDNDGNDKIICTDVSRNKFQYKDENTGELVHDVKLEKLRTKLCEGVDKKKVYKELLDYLFSFYGDDGEAIYEKFNNLKRKLEFNCSFMKYVGNKTYNKNRPIINFID